MGVVLSPPCQKARPTATRDNRGHIGAQSFPTLDTRFAAGRSPQPHGGKRIYRKLSVHVQTLPFRVLCCCYSSGKTQKIQIDSAERPRAPTLRRVGSCHPGSQRRERKP